MYWANYLVMTPLLASDKWEGEYNKFCATTFYTGDDLYHKLEVSQFTLVLRREEYSNGTRLGMRFQLPLNTSWAELSLYMNCVTY